MPTAAREAPVLPATIADAGEGAAYRFIEFFTANIQNPNTRRAYFRATLRLFGWAHTKGLRLDRIRPPHVAAYMEELQKTQIRLGDLLEEPLVTEGHVSYGERLIPICLPRSPAQSNIPAIKAADSYPGWRQVGRMGDGGCDVTAAGGP